MKADLHVHSLYSADSRAQLEDIIEVAKERGIGCLAITDHNEFKAFEVLKDRKDIIIIPGEEVSSVDGHIIALGIDRRIPPRLSIEETVRLIHEAGGYAYAAHPYRMWSGLGEENTRNPVFDGTEARNFRSTPRANRRSEKLAKEIGKPVTAGSDAHVARYVGFGYVELPDTVTNWQEAVEAIRTGNILGVYSDSRNSARSIKYALRTFFKFSLRGFRKI